MKKLTWLFICVISISAFISCDSLTSSDDTIKATVYLQYPIDRPYNMFQVIESNDYDKSEINIHYGDYISDHPDQRETIEQDTIDVKVKPYTSKYGSVRYRLIDILHN